MSAMTGLHGYVPVSQVAAAMGISQRAAKRRLRRLQSRAGAPILTQFAKDGWWFADVAALKRHLPGLYAGDGPDPVTLALAEIVKTRVVAEETRDFVVQIRDAFAVQPGAQTDHNRPSQT